MRETMERAAGRELDAEIATKVMGYWMEDGYWWGPHPYTPGARAYATVCGATLLSGANYRLTDGLPYYSDDIAAAWTVVEKMQTLGVDCIVRRTSDGYWARAESVYGLWSASVDPRDGGPALAICRAALAAVATPTPEERPDGQ